MLTSIGSLPSVSFCDQKRRFITNHNNLPLLLGQLDMMSSRGKAGGAVSFLKAIFVDWALAQNAFIFETTAHRVAAYHVCTDQLYSHCSYSLKSAS